MHTKLFILFAISFFAPFMASAAEISLEAVPERVGGGDMVRVSVILDSIIPVNAFAGMLSYDAAMLEPIATSDGNSVISIWIARPAVPEGGTSIPFSGITPGGFSGNRGMLFSVLFRAKAAGSASVFLGDVEVLRNDGAGGEEPVRAHALTLSLEKQSRGGYAEPDDQAAPEPFFVYLGDDPELFGGRRYIVFTAVDKLSGIDHYAIAETRLPSFLLRLLPPSWEIVSEGPYALSDQRLVSAVHIKAVDRAGNERLTVFPPSRLFTGYEKLAFLAILLTVVFLSQKKWGRRFGKNL